MNPKRDSLGRPYYTEAIHPRKKNGRVLKNGNHVNLRLVHYGASHYYPKEFNPISDVPFRNKPRGGLWSSPVGSSFGWREWCEAEQYGDLKKSFDFDFVGSVLKIDSVADMESLPWIECNGSHFISFQALCAPGFSYDAIHLTERGQQETRFSFPKSLYGWDCECVLVLNPKSISFKKIMRKK